MWCLTSTWVFSQTSKLALDCLTYLPPPFIFCHSVLDRYMMWYLPSKWLKSLQIKLLLTLDDKYLNESFSFPNSCFPSIICHMTEACNFLARNICKFCPYLWYWSLLMNQYWSCDPWRKILAKLKVANFMKIRLCLNRFHQLLDVYLVVILIREI